MQQNMEQNKYSEERIFIEDLINASRKKNKEFKSFVDKKLNITTSPDSTIAVEKRIGFLKKMTVNEQIIIKSRAKEFEENNDPSKYLPSMIAIILLVISSYKILSEMFPESIGLKIALFVVTTVLAGFALKVFTILTYNRNTAIIFNNLLAGITFVEKDEVKTKEE